MAITIQQPVRECGERTPGGFYVCSEASEEGTLPLWTDINPPVPCADKFRRSPIIVDGSHILNRMPEDAWYAGSSAKRVEREHGNAWAVDTFGMSAARRMETGDCKGVYTADDALLVLIGKVGYDGRIADYLRKLSEEKVSSMPRLAEPFAEMVRGIQDYAVTRDGRHLIATVASIWKMADLTAPKKRAKVTPHLSAMLMLMGLKKDAIELRLRYPITA